MSKSTKDQSEPQKQDQRDSRIAELEALLVNERATNQKIMPIAEYLNTKGGVDAVQKFIDADGVAAQPAPQPPADYYEGLPEDLVDLSGKDLRLMLEQRDQHIQSSVADSFGREIESLRADNAKLQADLGSRDQLNARRDQEQLFRERHGIDNAGFKDFESWMAKQSANPQALQDIAYKQFLSDADIPTGDESIERIPGRKPSLPQGGGYGGGSTQSAHPQTSDDQYVEQTKQQILGSANEALAALMGPLK